MIDLFLQSNDQGYLCLFLLVGIGLLLKPYKRHCVQVLESMNMLMAISGVITLFLFSEQISTFFSGVAYQSYAMKNRMFGPYWFSFWFNWIGMAILTQLFWFRRLRRNILLSLLILLIPLFSKLFFLFTIHHRDYLPTSWAMSYPFYLQIELILLYCGLVLLTYLLINRIQSIQAK